jgi:hypothetical protein
MRICAAMDDAEERIRVERNAAARKDEDLVRAGKEVRASAMNRRSLGGERSSNKCAEPVDIDNVDDMESQLDGSPKNASNSSDLPSGLTRGRKRKRSTLDLEEILAGAEGPRADQESLRIKVEAEILDFDRERAADTDEKEKRSSNSLNNSIGTCTNTNQKRFQLQLKMTLVLDKMLKSARQ